MIDNFKTIVVTLLVGGTMLIGLAIMFAVFYTIATAALSIAR